MPVFPQMPTVCPALTWPLLDEQVAYLLQYQRMYFTCRILYSLSISAWVLCPFYRIYPSMAVCGLFSAWASLTSFSKRHQTPWGAPKSKRLSSHSKSSSSWCFCCSLCCFFGWFWVVFLIILFQLRNCGASLSFRSRNSWKDEKCPTESIKRVFLHKRHPKNRPIE